MFLLSELASLCWNYLSDMSDESGKDSEEFSEISDMDSDSEDEDGALMRKQDTGAAPVGEAFKDASIQYPDTIHTLKKVPVVGASEEKVLVTGDKEGDLGMSLYEMVRHNNIQERQEMFRETFKEIGELKNSLIEMTD